MCVPLKNKRVGRAFVAVIAAFLQFLGAGRASASNTVYVPDNYPTIQEAVGAAASGDTIIVRDGCYAENILVNTGDLTIKSLNGPSHVFISAADPDKSVFELNRNRITISGLTIEGATNAAGIAIKYFSTENKITNNEFAGNKYGIHISLYSYLNEMTGNIFKETNDYGLYLQEAFDSGSGATRKSSANNIYLNDFYSKIFAGSGWPYYNFWKTGEEINYQNAGGYHKNRLGNYYLYYDGTDDNSDGIGEKAQVLNGETDNYPLIKPLSNYEILTEEPDWTFAVLTDLHIGWGIPDYGKPGYEESDNEPGQDYYLTDRLNKAVEWINAHAVSNNIKFVTVLGDITDTAEYSEFLKARQILNQLVVPYIPIIGNHDIWPYTSSAMYSPDTRAIPFTTEKLGIGETASPQEKIGDGYFEQVFWQENQLNVNKINALFPDFSRETFNVELENYSFEYRGTKFISLDFASRDQKTQLFDLLNATDIEATVDYLKQQLTDCGDKKIVLLTHFPFKDMAGGFQDGAFLNIDKALIDSNCNFINFAGHSHNNKFTIREVNGKKYPILETEAISQAKFLFESAENKFLRIITPNKWTNLLTDNYDNFVTVSSSAINPYITMFPAEVVPFQTSVFVANSNNKPKDQIESYTWQFDDDEPFTTANDRVVKYISQTGQRKIKLTVKDTSGNTESLAWNFSVIIDTRPGKKVIMIGGTLIPVIYTGVDLRDQQYAQNTKEWVFVTNNDHKLLGAFDTHFELAKTDIDLSDLAADLDASQRAAFMHMENWPKEIENSKILYIPSTGKGQVYICPQADSLDKVKPDCQDATVLTVGETKNGMTVSEIDYNGQLYYQVYGITGTGGGELDLPANSSLESQIQITKLEYDGEDILNQAAADLGDKRLPLLLSELKQDKINLTSYLPENKKKLNPWQKKKLNYKLKFLETIGNEWQGKKIKIWFNFEASQ